MKHLFKSILVLGVFLMVGCQNHEEELLTPKLYFETSENFVKVGDTKTINQELKVRLSSKTTKDVTVTYSIGDKSLVDSYNARFGKEYKSLNSENISLEEKSSVIKSGDIYSKTVNLQLNNVDTISVGNTYLVPICANSDDVSVITGEDITYFILTKPVEVKEVGWFEHSNSAFITLNLTPLKVFQEVTYEAIVCPEQFIGNMTVMGCEGVMIMRIGDTGGTTPADILQIAGKGEITWKDNPLEANKWYHLAFTCTSDGKGTLYVNGEPVVDGGFTMSPDLTANNADYGFSIGRVPHFLWGSRPFDGYMSEVRLWDVVRTPAQIKENMLNVDPKTPGLVGYFKLNGNADNYAHGGLPAKEVSGMRWKKLTSPVVIGEKVSDK